MLKVNNVTKFFHKNNKSFCAVDSLDLHISPGEIYAFLGPNGAGKTTTIKIIAGLVQADKGNVLINGQDTATHKKHLNEIGAVLEGNRNLYWRMTPIENLCYFGGLKGMRSKEAQTYGRQLLTRFGLENKIETTVQQLSRGMQQKVAICAALIHKPKLLLLDEPTLGLDFEASEKIKELILEIARTGVSILLTTHQLDVAQELADRVGIIRGGKLVLEGITNEILQQYTKNEYTVTVGNTVSAETKQFLLEKGAVFHNDSSFKISFKQKTEIYEIIALLHPNPIINIALAEGSLTDVFKEMITV
ncbi:ABC transporter ATP-binding protein [Falsibacillus pallidus]|uniref:ABC-2 type transport system ATP-binding protein n=1 Tax=Falsibacillus pallidus TaxID=493781 RepID=A0A370G353_9BACI|nr:ABC transporter ATP-binding protein [Falsibacillus pallidus]RDI37259.1 ABC-2 type transport system ATP-binding protein [Falsibacillus pallidus]